MGSKHRRDLDEPVAHLMAIKSELIGEFVEGIRIEIGRKDAEACFDMSCGLAIRRSAPYSACRPIELMVIMPDVGC